MKKHIDTILAGVAIVCILWFGYATSRSPEPKVVVQTTNESPAVVVNEPPLKDIPDDGHYGFMSGDLQGIMVMREEERPATIMQMYDLDLRTMKFNPTNHIQIKITNLPARHTTMDLHYLGGSNILIDLSNPTRPMR